MHSCDVQTDVVIFPEGCQVEVHCKVVHCKVYRADICNDGWVRHELIAEVKVQDQIWEVKTKEVVIESDKLCVIVYTKPSAVETCRVAWKVHQL